MDDMEPPTEMMIEFYEFYVCHECRKVELFSTCRGGGGKGTARGLVVVGAVHDVVEGSTNSSGSCSDSSSGGIILIFRRGCCNAGKNSFIVQHDDPTGYTTGSVYCLSFVKYVKLRL